MLSVPEKHRDGAWLAWRALALVAALWLSQAKSGTWTVPLTIYGAGVAVWVVFGWQAKRPARVAAAIAAAIVVAEHFVYGLPRGVLWFVPVWAILFGLPAAFQEGGLFPALWAWLIARSHALEPPLTATTRWLARFPKTCECLRIAAAAGAGLFAIKPFLHDGVMGGVDAKWYAAVVADHLEQWRMGLGPVFVGQTYYAAVGTVMPLRVAPYLQHLTVALDLLTGRSLSPYLLLNLAIVASSVAGCLSAYFCLRAIMPGRRLEALLLAVIYAWCPAVIGLAYTGQLFMSVMTLPYLPLVFSGVVMITRRDDFTGWAMVAAGCAACWLCHSPIGIWICFCAATALAARWAFAIGWSRRELLRATGAGLLFLGLCGYVFLSIWVLVPPKVPPTSVWVVLPTLRAMFPDALLPVSHDAAFVSDLQPGWSVLVALLFAAAAWRPGKGVVRALLVVALVLVCLSMPVPLINEWLWRAVPQAVLNATNAVPTQRLYPILAGCAVVLAASALEVLPRRRAVVVFILALGVAWSGLQLRPFLHRGSLLANSRESSREALSQDNLILASFSNAMFANVSPFFTYGFMDFEMEQRVLGEDMKDYVVTDVGSVAPGYDFKDSGSRKPPEDVFVGKPAEDGRRWIEINPRLTLEPGAYYLLAFSFSGHPYKGVLQVSGPEMSHEYILPLSGEGFAFGTDPANSHVIPLSNGATSPIEVRLDFVVQDPEIDLGMFRQFARFKLIRYDPKELPVRLISLVPYVAKVRTPAPGWYESFRYYTAGWTASVNGRPGVVRKSPHGLIAVHVDAGESEVRLAYRAPFALVAVYWLTWACWAGLIIGALRAHWRR